MTGYTEFADKLRRTILPDVPMTSYAEWKFHRVAVDWLHLYLLVQFKARMMECTRGMSEEEIKDLYDRLLDFFGERYSERGMVNPPSKIDSPTDVNLNWATDGQIYVNQKALYYTNHFIRLKNGASVNFIVYPSKEGCPTDANQIKGRRYVLFNYAFADPNTDDAPASSIEEWDDDLFVYFHYRNDITKKAQGKYNDETEKAIRAFIGKDRKYAELLSRQGNGKTLLRQELNRFTSRVRPGQNEKYVHKDLRGHLMNELDEYIKKRMLDLDGILKMA